MTFGSADTTVISRAVVIVVEAERRNLFEAEKDRRVYRHAQS